MTNLWSRQFGGSKNGVYLMQPQLVTRYREEFYVDPVYTWNMKPEEVDYALRQQMTTQKYGTTPVIRSKMWWFLAQQWTFLYLHRFKQSPKQCWDRITQKGRNKIERTRKMPIITTVIYPYNVITNFQSQCTKTNEKIFSAEAKKWITADRCS